jgi:hypothetical protein
MHTFSSQFELSTGFLADAACLSQDILIYFPFSNSSFALISGLSLFFLLEIQ